MVAALPRSGLIIKGRPFEVGVDGSYPHLQGLASLQRQKSHSEENFSGLTDFFRQVRAELRKTLFRPSDYRLCAPHVLAARFSLGAQQDVQCDPHRIARSAHACYVAGHPETGFSECGCRRTLLSMQTLV